ncbi:hypothetical protein SAMN05216428_11289 [Nitrosospira sp. Nsp11]|uniref:hypothetical protein n=1 Tax=Nitrosospira sp. Nsp11 TaxID=1855338 RepID=UPI00091711CD|nr:hypothetical protein [Nitrosospira sp. Nsp11]SHM05460.1 hypothetical protein SAMN05216428_11289 [Nitrosospira sp. Nsp11]
MENRIISRERLFSFKDSAVTEVTVFLTVRKGEEPVIETEPGVLNRTKGIDVRLSSLLKIAPIEEEIYQEVGDGPELEKLDKARVIKAVQESLKRIPVALGKFEIVWVPDDGVPF